MRPFAVVVAIAAGGAIALPGAHAQAPAYPSKPIRLIVPWPAGGGADVIGRTTAAKAAPDGYTIYQGNTATLGINPALRRDLPYDATKDFAPISLINTGALIVVIHPSLPVKNVRDLVLLAKARPGQINYASAGAGSPSHLVSEMFKTDAGIKLEHIPYKGAAPAIIDLLAGQIDLMFSDFITCFPHVKAGKLRAIAVTAGKRSPLVPEIPTMKESGGPDLQAVSWSGILAPAGTPPAIVQRLNAELVKIAASADFNEKMRVNGGTPISSTPEEFTKYIRTEIVRYTKAVRDSGTKVE